MPETTALGAAMAAGAAEGVNVWYMSAALLPDSTSTTYQPQINPEGEDGGTGGGGATWLQVEFNRRLVGLLRPRQRASPGSVAGKKPCKGP